MDKTTEKFGEAQDAVRAWYRENRGQPLPTALKALLRRRHNAARIARQRADKQAEK